MTRRRRLLPLVASLAAVGLYLVWWLSYAGVHLETRYRVLPAGATAAARGSTLRLLSLTRTDLLGDSSGGDAQPAVPGATWVVAELEAVREPVAEFASCEVVLVGSRRQAWKTEYPSADRAVPECSSSQLVAGRPYRFEAVFAVPSRDAGEVVGVAPTDPSVPAARVPVMVPPR